MNIGIIGAGNVGATLASRISEKGLADVVLLDIMEGIAKGKAEDINDSLSIIKASKRVFGTSNYKDLADSSVIIITAGLPREPGMSREELLKTNLAIIKDVSKNLLDNCKEPVVITVTNPLDIMTYAVLKNTGYPKSKVFGMAGTLDCGRLVNILSRRLNVMPSKIKPAIIGPHNDDMIVLTRLTKVAGKPVSSLLKQNDLSEVIRLTKERGAYIVSLLGKGSAYFAPSQAIFLMIESIIKRKKNNFYISCYLNGQYGLSDVCIGAPAVIGENGIERIIELALDKEEKRRFFDCAAKIKETIETLGI
jgi:malate dehydrogenase